jgi:hypothetical protein
VLALRGSAGTSTPRSLRAIHERARAETVAVIPGVVPHLSEWLGPEVATEPAGVAARTALVAALT